MSKKASARSRPRLKDPRRSGSPSSLLTISLIAVLIPLLFMGDIVGRLFREFAVTLSVTILVSAVVSLTLTPMMSARLLKHTPESEQGRLFRASERIFERVIEFYGRTLKFVLRFQTTTLLIAVATLLLTVFLFYEIPKGFFPIQDTGVIQGVTEAVQSVSFNEMSRLQQSVTKTILQDPAVDSLSSFIGIDGTNTTLNSGRIQINLKPLSQRDASATGIIRRLQPSLSKISGITLYMQPVQDLTVDDRVSRTQFQYTLEDPNADELNAFAPKDARQTAPVARIERCCQRSTDSRSSSEAGVRSRHRFAPRHHPLPPSTRHSTDAYGQRQVSTIFTQLNQYHVVLEVKPGFDQRPLNLSDLYIRSGMAGSSTGIVSGGSAATASFGPSSSASSAVLGDGADRIFGRRRRWHFSDRSSVTVSGRTGALDVCISQRRPGASQRFHATADNFRPDYPSVPKNSSMATVSSRPSSAS